MNYPFTKKKPLGRFVSLALVLALMLATLSGCSLLPSGDETTEPTEEATIATTEPPTEAPTEATTEPAATESRDNIAIVKEQTILYYQPSTGSRSKADLDAGGEVDVARITEILEVKWVYGTDLTSGELGWIKYDCLDMSNVSLDKSYSEESTEAATEAATEAPTTSTDVTSPTVNSITGTSNTTTAANYGVVTASELNIRQSASQDADKVGSYTYGDRVAILETSNGWGRTDKGWISLSYVYIDGNVGTNTGYGTVTATQLNVREGPGTTYEKVKTLSQGDHVQILEQVKIGTTTWGYTSGGWVSMDYITMDGTTTTGTTTTGTATTGTGVVTTGIYIRAGAGTSYEAVGSMSAGDVVTILETATAEGYTWGRTSLGWICMNYVTMN